MSKKLSPNINDWPTSTVFTVGHSNRSIDDFLNLLNAYAIRLIVDVRTIPKSRHNPQFNADALTASLVSVNIAYLAFPALGGLRHARTNSINGGWHNKSFRGFADYMQSTDFSDALDRLEVLAREQRIAIMCAESVPWRCHRSLIADALTVLGDLVVEILSATNWRQHRLTPFAVAEGTQITYPPTQSLP
jgi:uncharacterized protein (DUF488 family)